MLLTGPGSGSRPRQHPVDLLDVPADAVERPVDVGAGEPPRLADLPDEQQGEQVTVQGQLVERGDHPGLAVDEGRGGPVPVLGGGEGHRGPGRLGVEAGQVDQLGVVDRGPYRGRDADRLPGPLDQVAEGDDARRDARRGRRLRGRPAPLGPGSPARRCRRQGAVPSLLLGSGEGRRVAGAVPVGTDPSGRSGRGSDAPVPGAVWSAGCVPSGWRTRPGVAPAEAGRDVAGAGSVRCGVIGLRLRWASGGPARGRLRRPWVEGDPGRYGRTG